MKKWLVALLLIPCAAQADIRTNLLTRLNQIMDDASNAKMTAANKYVVMNEVGREFGRRGLYVKRDTIVTSANTEAYNLNSDFAGSVAGAYLKNGQERRVLPVIPRDSAFSIPKTTAGVVSYLFVETDGRLGVHAIPLYSDTIILLYSAYPSALSGDSTEWDLPDHYEHAALFEVAADCLRKLPTAEGRAAADACNAVAAKKLEELQIPAPQSRGTGTVRVP